MRIKHTLGKGTYKNGKINYMPRKPREYSMVWQKSAKEYHSLNSSTEPLQVVL
jgi:hypothetical protein